MVGVCCLAVCGCSLLEYIDVDHDGVISYAEFLNSFELQDPSLQTHLQRSKSIRDSRTGPNGLSVRIVEETAEEMKSMRDREPEQSLSPTHAGDISPPRLAHTDSSQAANDATDHDQTSTSHMAKRQKKTKA
jgi:hypothetical protein